MGAFEDQFGKVSAQIFKEDLMGSCGTRRKEVLCGPSFGVDTSIIDLKNGSGLAVASDPLSLIPSLGMEVSAWLSVHLIVNDICTTGFSPQYAQFVLNLPVSLSREDFASYWNYIHSLCAKHEIAITGGHTGQIPGQDSTISGGGTMFVQAPLDQFLTSNKAKPGDSIIVTKQSANSATALLAMAFPETVKNKCGDEVQQKVESNFWNLSVKKEALIASQNLIPHVELTTMHDVTEGGVLGAINELAIASSCGFTLIEEALPISEEVSLVAHCFEIDPFVSIGSGAMIMTVTNGAEEKLINKLNEEGIRATRVGHLTAKKDKIITSDFGAESTFQFNGIDPYWAAFFNALKAGWN